MRGNLDTKQISRQNIGGLVPKLLDLEKSWTGAGEPLWTYDSFTQEMPEKFEGLSMYIPQNGDIAGYIIGSRKDSTSRIHKIVVHPEYKRMGMGSKLWQDFVNVSRQKGVERMQFKVLTDNIAAINLYRDKGCLVYNPHVCSDDKERYNVEYFLNAKDSINHSSPSFNPDDAEDILETIRAGNLAKGHYSQRFKDKALSELSKKYGVLTNSGQNALFLALRALDIKEGNEVIMPSYCCQSVWGAINKTGATPVLTDINSYDDNISFEDVCGKTNGRTKAIIVPHMFGYPVKNIEAFKELDIPIIEDCAQSFGAIHDGQKVGSFGDLSIGSFYATKMITTAGNGGIVATDDEEAARRLEDLVKTDGRNSLGEFYSFPFSEINGAFGISQIEELPEFISRRKEIAQVYLDLLSDSDFVLPKTEENIFYRFILKHKNSDEIIMSLRNRGIEATKPVLYPLNRDSNPWINLPDEEFPNTSKSQDSSVSIPIYPKLSNKQVIDVVSALKNWRFE